MLLLALACHDEPKTPTPTNVTETDADADADTDADADPTVDSADSGATEPTETGGSGAVYLGPITGTWDGECETFVTGSDFYVYSFDLDLTEAAGAVAGRGHLGATELATTGSAGGSGSLVTTYSFVVPIRTEGTWDGTDLALSLSDEYGSPLALALMGPVSGAEFDAELSNTQSTGYPVLSCPLYRR